MWSYIKSKKVDHCGVAPLRHNDRTYTDSKDKASILNDYFASVFVSEDGSMPTLDSNSFPDISPLLIHDEGVANLLSSLDDHKASGPDEIPTTLLKKLATVISPVLTRIFQASLHQCLIPMDWKSANVVPVFKKGERSIPSNYRPVSLTCICSKLLEHIIYSHIFLHLKKYDILCEEQHGFRANRSCETQLISTVNDIAENMDAGKQTDVILLDFSKAFDRVSHMRLCHKLHHLGINGSLLAWIKCFLSERTQRVIVNGQRSSPSVVLSGVPQGSVLGPLLFLCYINDIISGISSPIKLYADDVLIYRIIDNEDDCKMLQRDLDLLQTWAHKWNMSYNPVKCEFLRITNKQNRTYFPYSIQDTLIREVTQAKYLGVTLNNKLTWNNHIANITGKANSVHGFMHRNFNNCPSKIKSALYKSMMRPILEYAGNVWSPHCDKDIQCMERVQRRAARFAANCYSRYHSVTDMMQKLNWPTLKQRRNESKLVMMYKIIHGYVHIQSTLPLVQSFTNGVTRGHHNKYLQPATRTDVYKYSFFPSAIKLWNTLPEELIDAKTIDEFKNLLSYL